MQAPWNQMNQIISHQSQIADVSRLIKFVQKRRNRSDVLAVGNNFAFEFDARVRTQLALEVRTEHLLTLRAISYTNT